jgi:hypothetical protein
MQTDIINKKDLKCIRCGETLDPLYDEEFDDEYTTNLICPNCGCIHLTSFTDDTEDYHYFNKEVEGMKNENHGYIGLCPVCRNHLIIVNNFMRSEVLGDIDGPVDQYGIFEDDSMTEEVTCPNCGTYVSLIPPKPSEEGNYPFYKEIEEET